MVAGEAEAVLPFGKKVLYAAALDVCVTLACVGAAGVPLPSTFTEAGPAALEAAPALAALVWGVLGWELRVRRAAGVSGAELGALRGREERVLCAGEGWTPPAPVAGSEGVCACACEGVCVLALARGGAEGGRGSSPFKRLGSMRAA